MEPTPSNPTTPASPTPANTLAQPDSAMPSAMSSETPLDSEEAKYEFGTEFQTLILAYLFRDVGFQGRTEGLIKPGYFETEVHGVLAHIALEYYGTYKTVPSRATLSLLLKEAIAKKQIRPELTSDVAATLRQVF